PDGLRREVPVPMWNYSLVSPSYFRTIRRPTVYGSDFAPGAYDVPVVVIDEEMAKFLWPGVNPVGRLIKFGDERSAGSWVRVIGVVKDVLDPKARDLDEFYGRHPAGVYRTFSSEDTSRVAAASISIYVHATADGDRVAVGVRHMLADLPNISGLYVATFAETTGTRRRRAQDDFMAMLFSLFSVVALGLAAVGVYGIVSHSVNERRREFGVRISLGASTKDILRNVLGEGNVFALSGVAVGLYLARGTAHWVGMFMTEMHDLDDAGLYAAVASVLVVTAFIAAMGPAWRATRIAPVEAMRNE
ncbi:MAG TPA: FtsX-like permease family protein, partial [Gemmatimonadaceae bacterium]